MRAITHPALIGTVILAARRAEICSPFHPLLSGEPAATNACCDDCGPAAEMRGGALLACRGGRSAVEQRGEPRRQS